ncbi:S-methyl-5'-thioadenosine phosphorylase [Govanella unica]|uniref:Purine nucleoside phosphorylase n=1 Tax=Govanella unica TaxID=2975056 RepID=A0A9X3TXB3_9PROT|nr:S-methyl-5'-thioadenosine phosphorylase [Govania unica]MDA5193405.1 S-methyl-5'-thioadenosine phosphorylase [Govania unica]
MGVLGIIGGSGLYDLPGLGEDWRGDEPFGPPSAAPRLGRIGGQDVAFLPRHGAGHRLPPSAINYRANIDALKRLGVTDILSISACGSLREDLAPGSFVLVDQFIDRTIDREKSFFGPGCVGHVGLADPVCSRLGDMVAASLAHLGLPWHRGGTYLAMEGPQFSTRAESRLYRQWGADVIGMTNMPEAKLAREAEICYATVAMVTDYDSWHDERETVELAQILKVMQDNARHARSLVQSVATRLGELIRPEICPAGCDRALEGALVTAVDQRDPALLARLDAVAGRVLRAGGGQ